MAMQRCARCGKSFPKGDKIAEISHLLRCKKSVVSGGALYLGKSHAAKQAGKKK